MFIHPDDALPPFIECDSNDEVIRRLLREVGRKDFVALVEKICPQPGSIRLQPIPQGLSGSYVFRATLHDTQVGRQIPQVVKIGNSREIQLERDQGIKFVLRSLKPAPLLLSHVTSGDWAMLNFSFEGVKSLADRIREIRASGRPDELRPEIEKVIDYFRSWYDARRRVLSNLVFEQYRLTSEYWSDFEKRTAALRTPPVAGLEPIAPLSSAPQYWSRPYVAFDTWLCTCHGDLHPYNLLLTAQNELCAIDFRFTEDNHHFLRDLVTLELDTILKVLAPQKWEAQVELKAFHGLKSKLFNVDHFVPPVTTERIAGGASAALLVAHYLRSIAWQMMDRDARHIPEYFVGLLRYAISRAGRPKSGLTDCQRWLAAHFASELETSLNRTLAARQVNIPLETVEPKLNPRFDMNPTPFQCDQLLSRFCQRIYNWRTINERAHRQANMKSYSADNFLRLFFTRIFQRPTTNLFFESGSSIAALAQAVSHLIEESKNLKDFPSISVETNNILACLEFELFGSIPVTLYPPGPPEDRYGATFGPLFDRVWKQPPPRSANPAPSYPTEIMDPMVRHFQQRFSKDGIIFMTASRLEMDRDKGFQGPHVGSYPNMLFKRVLLEADCPTVMFLDQSKIAHGNFNVGTCYPVCDRALSWEKVCRSLTFALAIGAEDRPQMEETIKELSGLGLDCVYIERETDKTFGVVLANQKFDEYFALKP